MSKVEYAPIVFGRTYEVDFRFLVVPEEFQQINQAESELKNREWLERHIDATMLLAQQLPKQPRWSIFKNSSHCIVGVTCMASEVSEEKTQDQQGRPLYVFLGYAFRPAEIQPLSMHLDNFKALYRHVAAAWDEKSYVTRSKVPELERYQEFEIPPEQLQSIVNSSSAIELNFEADKVHVWADSKEFREKLWSVASYCRQPVSVCLGLPNEASALGGKFVNATTVDFPMKVLDRGSRSTQGMTPKESQSKRVLKRQSALRPEEGHWAETDKALGETFSDSAVDENVALQSPSTPHTGQQYRKTPKPLQIGSQQSPEAPLREFFKGVVRLFSVEDPDGSTRSPDEFDETDENDAEDPRFGSPQKPSERRPREPNNKPPLQRGGVNPESVRDWMKPKEADINDPENQKDWF